MKISSVTSPQHLRSEDTEAYCPRFVFEGRAKNACFCNDRRSLVER